jgi:uncharacterized protein (TIRG00374 family)
LSRALQLAFGILVSAVCLWLAMHDVRLGEVLFALRHANYLGFALLMALTLLGFWLRALRWRWLIHSRHPIGIGPLFSATMIGFMANNLLPLRLGEFVRAWALGLSQKMSKTTVFATVVVERVVDMITLVAIFGLAVWVHPLVGRSGSAALVHRGAGLLMFGAIGLTTLLVLMERWPRLAEAIVRLVARPLPATVRSRAEAMLGHFVAGLGLFRDLPRLAWVFALSFLMFGVFALCLTVSMWALRIDQPWYAGLVMLVVTAIGIMVPAAPGYIGTLHVSCKIGLGLFGVAPEISVPFSWFFWAGQWIPITLTGLLCLRRQGLSLAAVGRASAAAGE